MQQKYDRGTRRTEIRPGEYVFERNERHTDSLDLRFNGPYRVIGRRGADVKIDRGRGAKWVHLSWCKLYRGSRGSDVMLPNSKISGEMNNRDTTETSNEVENEPLMHDVHRSIRR